MLYFMLEREFHTAKITKLAMHYKQSKVTGQDAFNKKPSTVVFPFASIAQYSNH